MSLTFTKALLVLSIVLVAAKCIVNGLAGRIAGQLVFILPLTGYSIYTLSKIHLMEKHRYLCRMPPWLNISPTGKRQVVLCILFLVLVCVSFIRSIGISESFTAINMVGRLLSVIVVALTAFCISYVHVYHGKQDNIWPLITFGLGIYIIINIIGGVMGIENPFHDTLDLPKADVISSVFDTRVSFPFSGNVGLFGLEVGLFGTLVVARLFQAHTRHKAFHVLMLLLVACLILAANTRTAIVGLAVVAITALVWRTRARTVLMIIVLCMIFLLPLLVTSVGMNQWLERQPVELSVLSRTQDIDRLATLNNRATIWEMALGELRACKWIHLVGYGAFAQVRTGLCYYYGGMWETEELISLHNTSLQQLFDIGYIGLCIFLAMIINVFIVIGKGNRTDNRKPIQLFHPAFAALLYLVVCGTLGITLYHNQTLLFYLFMFINCQVFWYDTYQSNVASRRYKKI